MMVLVSAVVLAFILGTALFVMDRRRLVGGMSKDLWWTIVGLVLLAAVLWIIAWCSRPRLNADLLGYTATVIAMEHDNPVQVHSIAYDCLNCLLPAAAYREISAGSPHRQAVAKSPELLWSVLPIYRARIAYVWPAWLLTQCGLTPVRALTILPVVAMMGAAVGLYWLAGGGLLAAVKVVVAVWLFAWLDVAAYATSDAAACLWAILFIGAVVKRQSWWMIPAALCLCSRIDLALLLPACLWAWGSWRFRGLGLGLLLVLYAVLSWDYPGWGWQFSNEFLGRMNTARSSVSVSWEQYEAVLWRGLRQLAAWPAFGAMVALAVATARWDRRWLLLAGIPVAFIVAHVVLYPAVYPRFFAWCGGVVLCLSRERTLDV